MSVVAAMEVDTVVVMAAVMGTAVDTDTDTGPDTAEVVTDTAPGMAGAATGVAITVMATGAGSASTGTRSSDTAPLTMTVAATAMNAPCCTGAHAPQAAVTGGRAMRSALTTTIN
jgi:hypothetical protein